MLRNPFAFRILVTLVVTAVTFWGLELYLRREVTYVVQHDLAAAGGTVEQTPEFLITVKEGHRRLAPNAQVVIRNHFTSHRDIPIATNSLGLRHRELTTPKPPHELRVLVLGDSTTIMDYLPDDETYVRQTEQLLRAQLSGRSLEVINAGIGNTGTEEQLALLKELGTRVQPDIVVIGYYLNDSRPPWGFSGEIGNYGWLRRHSLLLSTIYRLIRESIWGAERRVQFEWIPALESLPWREDRAAFLELARKARFDWGAAWEKSEQEQGTKVLEALVAEIRSLGAQPLGMIFPPRYQVESSFEERAPQEWFGALFQKLQVPYLDLLPALRAEKTPDLFYDHCHLTEKGAARAAQKLAAALLPLLTS